MSEARENKPRAIAIFGGTFDPIHFGHVIVAEAAARRFHLSEIHFVPSSHPPHKNAEQLAPFWHRYAMVALACAAKPRFIPSLAEAPRDSTDWRVFYSVDTIARFRHQHPHNQIYFMIGADSFLEIAAWRQAQRLLDSCDFIIANRPGVRVEALRGAIPAEMLAPKPSRGQESIALRKSTVHVLTTVASAISSTGIRRRCKRGMSIRRLVPPAVEDYIRKQALYR
ncbi:MAG TPA: nicotinate-nucleotide adenylyltransferase [Candidatus Acidoferrales bacterium]|nr:nicotinate-nucleotide adenylyltransferase [Candidatus Acidoferrales bacterium]